MVSAQDFIGLLSRIEILQPYLQNEYAQFAAVLIIFAIIGGIFHFVLKGFFHKLTLKTKTDIDDIIYGIVKMPIFIIINLVGFYLALGSLVSLNEYSFYIDGAFFILITLVGTVVAGKIFSLFVGRVISHKAKVTKAPGLLMKVLNIIIYLLALLVILNHFNVDVTAAVAALGIGGIAIGFALQGTLTNFFSGLHIVTDRPINVGDYIELKSESIEGYVLDIGWRSTRIRTLPNNVVIIPNSKLAESVIMNNTILHKETGFTIDCGVGYGSDLEKVEKVTLEVARKIQKNVSGAVKSHDPLFRYKEFGDSNINFYVVLRVENFINKYSVRNEFIKALKKEFDKKKIEISWPVRKVYNYKGK